MKKRAYRRLAIKELEPKKVKERVEYRRLVFPRGVVNVK